MKKYLGALVLVLALSVSAQAGIYNNTGTTSEDSIGITFKALDTLGNPVDIVAGDSVYLMVFYPGGKLAFRDSIAGNNAQIVSETWEDYAGGGSNTYFNSVAAIDGTPQQGTYKVTITVHDVSLGLHSSFDSEFQLYETADFTTFADRLATTVLIASDNIGINWADVTNPTTTVGLSGTTIKASTDTETDIAALNDITTANVRTQVDEAFDSNTVDMGKISGLAAAADNLELMFDADTTNGPKVDLQQLTIYNGQANEWAIRALNNSNNTPAVIFQNNGTAEALDITSADGSNDIDVRFTTDNFSDNAFDSSDFHVSVSREFATLGIAAMNGAFTGTPTTAFGLSTDLTEADDFWNDNLIIFLDAPIQGQVARITDFVNTGDTVHWSPATTSAPDNGDRFIIIPTLYEGVGGASAADVADAVWEEDQADHTTGTTFGAIATEIAAVKTETDKLTFTVTNVLDANITHYEGATDVDGNIQSEVDDALTAQDVLVAGDTASLTASIAYEAADETLQRRKEAFTGTPTTTTGASTALTDVDDWWNENLIQFVDGDAAGQVARITDFDAGTDLLTWSPALTTAPAVTDSFIIIGILGESGSGVSAASIADAVWNEDTAAHYTSTSTYGYLAPNFTRMNNDAQSATDLQDFADDAYDPGANLITRVANWRSVGGADISFDILATMWGMLASPIQGFNLVHNGSFEASSSNYWSSVSYSDDDYKDNWYCDTCGAGDGIVNTSANFSGKKGLHLRSITNNTIRTIHSERMVLLADQTYYYGAWAKADDEVAHIAEIRLEDTLFNILSSTSMVPGGDTTEWQPYASSFTPEYDTIVNLYLHVKINRTSGTQGIFIDDVFLIPVGSDTSSGTSVSAAAIADAVWDEDTTGHYDLAQYGYEALQTTVDYEEVWRNIDTNNVDSSDIGVWLVNNLKFSAGAGSYADTILCLSNADTTAIDGMRVRVFESDGVTGAGFIRTESDGMAIFNLGSTDPDTFLVRCFLSGYTQDTIPDTTIVSSSGGTLDTVWFTPYPAILPDSIGLCRVKGTVMNPYGQVIEGAVVTVEPAVSGPARYGNLLIYPTTKTAETNSNGVFEIYVIPTASLVYEAMEDGEGGDSLFTYKASVLIPGRPDVVISENFSVPDTTEYELNLQIK